MEFLKWLIVYGMTLKTTTQAIKRFVSYFVVVKTIENVHFVGISIVNRHCCRFGSFVKNNIAVAVSC